MTISMATRGTWAAAATAFCLLSGCVSCGRDVVPPAGGATAAPSAAEQPGAIEGRLGFPSLTHPALSVYAIRVGAGSPPWYRLETAKGQISYVLGPVTPGAYTLVAYEADHQYGQPRVGGYTGAVVCGLKETCTDHTLVRVTVRPGETASGIDIADFAAPPGTFPPQPGAAR